MRWCVAHEAQHAEGVTVRYGSLVTEDVCWKAAFEPGGAMALSCEIKDLHLEPLADMERTEGEAVPPGEGWDVILDHIDEEGSRVRLWSKIHGYHGVLPGWFDKDWNRIPITEDF